MNRSRYIIALLVTVVAAAVLYAAYSFFAPRSSTQATLQVLVGTRLAAHPYNLVAGTLVDVQALPETSIVSRVRRADLGVTVSAILPADTVANTLLIEDTTGNHTIEDSGISIKDAVALSPDGQFVAYAELNLPFGEALYSDDIADWQVKIVSLTDGGVTTIGTGFAPHFVYTELGDRLVMFSTPEGVASYAIDSKEQARAFTTAGRIFTPQAAQATPDGNYLAVFNPVTNRYGLFTTSLTVPPRLSAYGGIPVPTEGIALTNEHVYAIVRDQDTNQRTLVRWRLAEMRVVGALPETVYTFADGELPYQIIP